MSSTSRAWASITVFLLACGGAPTTTPSPSSSPAPASAEKADGGETPPSTSPAPVVDDRQAILQLVLDHPALDGYWHVDTLPERAPLVVLDNPNTRGVALTKFDRPVEVRGAKALVGRPYVVVHALDIRADVADVRIEYAVEGIRASATLDRGGEGGAWQVTQLNLGER